MDKTPAPAPLVISYQIEQIYVEIARAAAEMGIYKLYRKADEPLDISIENNIRFAAVAISIVFAHGAIEACSNAQLHGIFKQIQAITPEQKEAGWYYVFKDEKYRRCFDSQEEFVKLCRGELKEKLKALTSALAIPHIHDEDPALWQQILAISESMRDFIVHPDPRNDRFQEYMDKIMQAYKAGLYSEIATKTIRYFYKKRGGKSAPEWLDKSLLFRFLNGKDLAPSLEAKKMADDPLMMKRKPSEAFKIFLWWVAVGAILVAELILGRIHTEIILSLTALSLLLYALIQIWELIHKTDRLKFRNIKIVLLASLLFGLTYYKCVETITPVIFMRHEINSKNVQYAKGDEGNIYFKTSMDILRPGDLKIANTYAVLTHSVDYDLLDKRTVFINYEFGDIDEINKAIATQGLIFTYETRACIFGEEYKKYRDRQKDLEKRVPSLGQSSLGSKPSA